MGGEAKRRVEPPAPEYTRTIRWYPLLEAPEGHPATRHPQVSQSSANVSIWGRCPGEEGLASGGRGGRRTRGHLLPCVCVCTCLLTFSAYGLEYWFVPQSTSCGCTLSAQTMAVHSQTRAEIRREWETGANCPLVTKKTTPMKKSQLDYLSVRKTTTSFWGGGIMRWSSTS